MTAYTQSLRLAEMVPGDPAVRNVWGTVLDQTISAIESAITGVGAISIAGLTTYTLTVANNAPDQSRQQVYPFTGALTGDCTVTIPAVPKVGYAANNTAGGHNVILTTGSGTTLTLFAGAYTYYFCDGTNVTSPAIGGIGASPIGSGMDFYGAVAPPGWLFPYGQAISRTSYASLFAVLGTTYGSGDGTTTFNLPDKRGRSSIAKDNMGGSAANRVTTAGSGVNGSALGATGGDQLPQAHAHAVTDPGHVHNISDPGHTHGITDPGHAHSLPYLVFKNDIAVNAAAAFSANASSTTSFQTTNSATTGISANTATTGVSVVSHTTGVSTVIQFAGAGQNLPPGIVCNYIIFAGV